MYTKCLYNALKQILNKLENEVAFVYETQKIGCPFLKDHFPNLNNVTYFSDSCTGQYINCKNFFSLSHHSQNFNLTATWAFLETLF